MDIQSIIREAGPIANIINVVVIGAGYYFLIKLWREWLRQSREERVAGGRPMLMVNADYSHLPEVNLVVQNFTKAPAKEITFEFSAPIEDSSGFVLSNLPFFKKGLPFLEPEAQIGHHWDHLNSLLPFLKEKGFEEGIKVTTRYKDLSGESYATEWTIHPLLFENDRRIERTKDMNGLVNAVEKIPKDVGGQDGHQKTANTREGQSWAH